MNALMKRSLLEWLSGITSSKVTADRLADGKLFVDLIYLSDENDKVDVSSGGLVENIEAFLDSYFDFNASSFFDVREVLSGDASEEELYGLWLTVLLGCLQSNSKQKFMNAALNLELKTQTIIFHLVEEPMISLSQHKKLTRDIILARFRKPLPSSETSIEPEMLSLSELAHSTLVVEEPNDLETKLRESEREKRRLQAELEKAHAERDEFEGLVTNLRQQADEARVRATEAESRASRLSRELSALHDQTDELTDCRAELTLREDEITNLKQRLNVLQDLTVHARKLEIENANLHQECADYRLKVDELLDKLNEVKDRRIMCVEVETLRSKLRDAQAQLAQLLIERQTAEKDTRQQQEMFSQLKLQQSLAEKRLARNNRGDQTTCDLMTPQIIAPLKSTDTNHLTLDDIEYDGGSPIVLNPTDDKHGKPELMNHNPLAVEKSGENMGLVLEHELTAARSSITKLKTELLESKDQLASCQMEIERLTLEVSQLTTDLTLASAQREISAQSAEEFQTHLNSLKSDLSTVEKRLFLCCSEINPDKSDNLVNHISIVEQLKTIGTGLSPCVCSLCLTFSNCLEDILTSFDKRLKTTRTALIAAESRSVKATDERVAKEKELVDILKQLEEVKQLLSVRENSLDEMSTYTKKLETESRSNTKLLAELREDVEQLQMENQNLMNSNLVLKLQHEKEMVISKELIDKQVQRLHELETNLACYQIKAELVDNCVQVNLLESEANVDQIDDEDPSEMIIRTLPVGAYEASSADRRGLSDELVRLHEELAQSKGRELILEQQIVETQNQLKTTEENLCCQSTLAKRAQQNWVLYERKCRQLEESLAAIGSRYSIELESLLPQMDRSRSEVLQTASQIETIQAKYEKERAELRQKLTETTCDLEKADADRVRLAERIGSLQRELDTTRSLLTFLQTKTMNSQSPNRSRCNSRNDTLLDPHKSISDHLRCSHRSSRADGCQSDSLEEWLESEHENDRTGRSGHRTNSYYCRSCQLDAGHCSHQSADPWSSEQRNGRHSNHSRRNRNMRSGTADELNQELTRLTSRTRALEMVAVDLKQNMDKEVFVEPGHYLLRGCRASAPETTPAPYLLQQQQQQQHPYHHHHHHPTPCQSEIITKQLPTSYAIDTDQSFISQNNQMPASAPVYPQHQVPSLFNGLQNYTNGHDLDTDADSSAYTDLSQVSPVSRTADSGSGLQRNELPQSYPPRTLASSVSPPNQVTGRSDLVFDSNRDYSIRPTYGDFPPYTINGNCSASKVVDVDPVDPNRLAELHLRNRRQPPHLRTSYPVETQILKPDEIVTALGPLASADDKNSKRDKSNPRKLSAPMSSHHFLQSANGILREVEEENIPNDKVRPNSLVKSGHKSTKSDQTLRNFEPESTPSPLAAGYHALPKDIHSFTEALISASDDPKTMIRALNPQYGRTSLSMSNPTDSKSQTSRNNEQNSKQSRNTNISGTTTPIMRLDSRQISSARTSNHPNGSRYDDENLNPPSSTNQNGIQPNPFLRPRTPKQHRVRKPLSNSADISTTSSIPSDDTQSLASSIRSGKSSIAFEIAVNSGSGSVRRLKTPRSSMTPSDRDQTRMSNKSTIKTINGSTKSGLRSTVSRNPTATPHVAKL